MRYCELLSVELAKSMLLGRENNLHIKMSNKSGPSTRPSVTLARISVQEL